ncbi:lipopolysaccharide transport periplasmic protein LptA [Moraxella bovis]|nr:lipopolysaccharide transport periplasmic protein LptA [Moraxella bovis]UYZ67494.1 lipopolysaccharide transport periplasmic protein LptA [Moraxella bovis]UYZ69855.1 lipopolysaccharide transport periplasmic protein LptA [Moraxella bovis]UYZ74224.1 lipopolysaccharide transport periplasmic protein LptA [Moraxella bovis]UZA13138.1 lipopolysaccharide transport periplasmic protein LptA [Moraxella bovis]UZA28523.1 lipopolysaccharide transport periplasmic protein LptA [Moraxella bovis]
MRTSHLLSAQILLFVAGMSMALSAHALPSDASQPIRLLADKATYSERTGVTSYSGNVIIEQGTLKITADNITLNLDDKRSIKTALATGRPATMQQVVTQEKGLAKGQANKIDYNAVTGIITLTGNAKLTQTGASFSGNTIRYSLKLGDVEANAGGGRRVELVFPPSESNSQTGVRP